VGVARRLAARGVPATILVDALAPTMAAHADAVVVGADAVTSRAIWNKCGTLALALGARAAGRPLYVVTTGDRLLGPTLARRLRVPDAEPHGVLARPPRGVAVCNRLFDVTPLRLVTRVLTEMGAMSPDATRMALRSQGAR
jgi:translation initiation factor 2B subunit (eIF-2B alpha/beta/delta family)